MTVYTKRTCHECGKRDIQPNMRQKTISLVTGSSSQQIGSNTWLGVLAGDKSSGRAVRNAIFGSNSRKYTRNKTVWVCKSCKTSTPPPSKPKTEVSTQPINRTLLYAVGFFILLLVLGSK